MSRRRNTELFIAVAATAARSVEYVGLPAERSHRHERADPAVTRLRVTPQRGNGFGEVCVARLPVVNARRPADEDRR